MASLYLYGLKADELSGDCGLDFHAKLNSFLDAFHEQIKGLCLCMTTPEFRHRSNQVPLTVPLDYDMEFTLHNSILPHPFRCESTVRLK